MTAGAWAQDLPEAEMVPESYIDVTPAYYKFYKGTANLDAMLRADVQLPAGFNLGSNNWVTNNANGKGENYFSAEQVANGNFLFGAWVMANNKKDQFKEGISLYDFGGNIQNALVINYQNSELNKAIQTALDLDDAPEIPVFDVKAGGNINIFALLDFNAMNDYLLLANPDLNASMLPNIPEEIDVTPIRIHVRLVLNAYNNDPELEMNALTFTYFQNEAGNTFGVTEPSEGSNVPGEIFAENGEWSPNGWFVRDYEFNYTGIAGAEKLQATSISNEYNDGAILIRSIEVYVVPEDEEQQLPNIEGKNYSANYDSWWDATKGSIDRPEEPEPVVLYIVGGNINGEADWNNGALMTYDEAKDIYTWSGKELGSGFMITNGTDEAEYNIGAGEGSLILGDPYKVSSGADSKPIEFVEGIDYVIDPVVEFSLTNMTLTVSGQGSGVTSLSNGNEEIEYLNLQGVKVANPERGIFIKKQGDKISKVVIR